MPDPKTASQPAPLPHSFRQKPQACPAIETPHRRIRTELPAPETAETLAAACQYFPQVNCYQPPIVWDHAEGYQVFDAAGNCWIDFTSTAVTTNIGHGHPLLRARLAEHVQQGLLAQFNFASEIRARLARELVTLAGEGFEKCYFWTVGSEAIEAAFRVARQWGLRQHPEKFRILAFRGDFHGWTLAAHQLSGPQAAKPWLPDYDPQIVHLPFPHRRLSNIPPEKNWEDWLAEQLEQLPVPPQHVAAVFIETFQGWGALPLPAECVQALRRWADEHQILVIFDEIQTGFGRTGKLFGHQHYDVQADLLCIGKGLTSSLPLAAVLGSAAVLDVLPPGEVTTTHAGHPLSCAAALACLEVLEREDLVARAAALGDVASQELNALQQRWPERIVEVAGRGLLQALHFADKDGQPDRALAQRVTNTAVRHGVMLFHTNQPTVKVCPPLVIPEEALREGIAALGNAIAESL